jgi:integrase
MTVFRRGDKWRSQVTWRDERNERQRANGTFSTQREALAWEAAKKTEIAKGEFVAKTSDTVGGWSDIWYDLKAPELKPSTRLAYRLVKDRKIKPVLGDVLLQKLTPLQIDQMYAAMLTKGLSRSTVRNVHKVLRQMLAEAMRKGLVTRNAADAATPPKARATELEGRKKAQTWTGDQLGTFIESIRGDRLEAAYTVLVHTGLRRGELLGLRHGDIDLDGGTLAVVQTLVAPGYEMMLTDPKTEGSKRTIGIGPATVAALRAHKERQQMEASWFGKAWGEHPLAADLVFTDEQGHPVKPALFSLAFKAAVTAAGLPMIRVHDIRHSHASLLVASGESIKLVQKRLGHASSAFTLDRYVHTSEAEDVAVGARFETLTTATTTEGDNS